MSDSEDTQSNYMSISSTEDISSLEHELDSLENTEDSITSGSDIESVEDAIPISFRGFFGRASEVLLPSVASFFNNGRISEGDENNSNSSIRPGFSPFSAISSTFSDIFRPSIPPLFSQTLRSYPSSMMRRSESQKSQLDMGGKVILPSSSLEKILRESQPNIFTSSLDSTSNQVLQNDTSPIIFKISSMASTSLDHSQQELCKSTFCGVLEFTSPEGIVYVPNWIFTSIGVSSGDLCLIERIESHSIPIGKFIKLQPQSMDFLELSDPKAVLENGLRNYNTLSPGDIFTVSSDHSVSKELSFCVLETLPGNSVISINDTDLEVDFAPPVGYIESDHRHLRSTRSILGVKSLSDYKVPNSTSEPYPILLPSTLLYLGPRPAPL